MTIKIRSAEEKDLDWLIGQLKLFSKFFGTTKSLFGDEANARNGMKAMMTNHLVYIADGEGVGPVGFIAGVITGHMFNPSIRLLSETFWWVQEEHRGSRAGLMLLNAFMQYGRKNADWITFALEEKSPVKESCLLKRGFHLQERAYLMEVF